MTIKELQKRLRAFEQKVGKRPGDHSNALYKCLLNGKDGMVKKILQEKDSLTEMGEEISARSVTGKPWKRLLSNLKTA